jgi:restriction system protein
MNEVSTFEVGKLYTNDQIRFSLAVENLGGIRPALDAQGNVRHVAVLTTAEEAGKVISENPYRDRIEGDILTYTAQGRQGDQQLGGRNKRLIEQYAVPVPFFGFINVGKQTYRFLGLLELLRHYQETQADTTRSLRRVWLFEFRIHANPIVVPIGQAKGLSASLLAESRQRTGWSPDETAVEETVSCAGAIELSNSPATEVVRSKLLGLDPGGFENFLRLVMQRKGFRDVNVTGKSGDGGIDLNGFVDETDDFFAGTHVQVQAKRWRHSVGSIEINHFRGALSTTAKGVFVTTSHYTAAAVKEARHPVKPCITLIDGLRLSTIVTQLKLEVT